jgi:arylsulfatase A-like enzyme
MPRHAFTRLIVMLSFAGVAPTSAAATSPNVIVVMTDDQGYGEFSCHGNPLADTPHIDRLAAQSLRLSDFHVAPMCTPTRGQLMTGLDAFRNGAINVSSGRTLLRPELQTIADVFQTAGYRTGIFGKWHLGDNYPFRPEDRGFDEAVWFPSSHINAVPDYWDNDYFDDTYIHNTQRRPYEGYCTDVFFREAMKWIAAGERGQPFFAYIPLNSAHWPWFVPDRYRAQVQSVAARHPEVIGDLPTDQQRNLISFLAMGVNIDENIGRLDAFLAEQSLFDNTIVVFLTDNGSTMGPQYFNAGMRGSKTTLWEGGHRVPCFIRWPAGDLGEPRKIAELSHVQDLLPTLADLAGIDNVPGALDGTSLAPLFRGERDSLGERMLVINYSRMPTFKVTYTDGNPAIPQREGAAVLWKHWRLLEDRMLFDLQSDLHQDHDVAAEHPEVVAKMRAHLDTWWDSVKDDVLEPQRVIIGSDHENPLLLSACEWLDVFVDQQVQIRRGVETNGVWHLLVDQPGTYTFELRRWPVESGLQLDAGCPPTPVIDGAYGKGRALPIASAKLRVGDWESTQPPTADNTAVLFRTALGAGPIELQTWMLDDAGKPICGAYFVTVTRIE